MAELEKLRQEHDALVLLVRDKQDAVKALDDRLSLIPGALVDAATKEARTKLVKELQTLRVERDVLGLELKELVYRRDLALLTIHEVELTLAQAEYDEVRDNHRSAKETWDAANVELRAYLNNRGNGDDRQTQRERTRELRVAEATTKAQMQVDAGRMQDAGRVVERVRTKLEEVKQELAL
jgi:hypothetical protein